MKGEARVKWETLAIVQLGLEDNLTRGVVAAGMAVRKDTLQVSQDMI